MRILPVSLAIASLYLPSCSSEDLMGRTASPKPMVAASAPTDRGKGRIGHGIIADHYDRDGDGKYEECRRRGFTYFDRNGDGIADLQIEESDEWSQIITWDENFDGIMDWQCVRSTGDPGGWWSLPRRVSHSASRVFLDDRIQHIERIPATKIDVPYSESQLFNLTREVRQR